MIDLKISAARPTTSRWVYANGSFLGTFESNVVVLAAQRLELGVRHQWIEHQYARQRFRVNPEERIHTMILPPQGFRVRASMSVLPFAAARRSVRKIDRSVLGVLNLVRAVRPIGRRRYVLVLDQFPVR